MLVTCFGFYKVLCVYAYSLYINVPCCMYCIHVYLYAYVTVYACMCIIRYLKNCILFHYSECQESPISQETNCIA